jgi:site-specific DNA-methyltransferase (adenine-specific)
MLSLFSKARAALAKAATIDEAKEIRDKAEALRIYAQQAGQAAEMERQCAEIRLRAERRIGELLAKTVRPGNPQLSSTVTIGLSELGITRNQSAKWQLAATLPAADFERYVSKAREPTTAGILRLVQERARSRQTGPASGGSILTGPATRLWDKLADSSVDFILTDPPYSEIERYRELAELAAVKLKPGGLCLAYCGQTYLPSVLEAMGKLTYHWTFAIRFGGPHRPIYPRRIQNTWQPVVAFSRGKPTAGWIVDMLESGGREKESHDYQKTLSDVEYLIERLTAPGALVVDPFCGSGTVPAACKKLGRRWLACEINNQTARAARRRVAA